MSDTLPNDTTTKASTKKRRLGVIIGAAIAVLIVGVILASRAGIDKAIVQQKLDDMIAHIKESGRAQGRNIEITYGDLEVIGGFTDKHVIIHNVSFATKPLEERPFAAGTKPPVESVVITTPIWELYPEAGDFSAFRVEVPQPINFAAQDAPEKSLLKITSNTPITVNIAEKELEDGIPTTWVKYTSPTKIDFTYLREQQATGDEEQTPALVPVYETLTIETAGGGTVESEIATDGSQRGKASINFSNVVLKPHGVTDGVVQIDTISGNWSNVLNEKKQNAVSTIIFLGPLKAPATLIPYAPITFSMDVGFAGSMNKSPESSAPNQAEPTILNIKKLRLSMPEADFSIEGNFTADASEPMPVGKAQVAIVNLPFFMDKFRKAGVLTPANEGVVTAMIELLGGFPIEKIQNTTFMVERERGGSLKIGYTTLEELFALFVKQALQPKSEQAPKTVGASPSAPKLPPADKPKAAPIHVPDAGTRG